MKIAYVTTFDSSDIHSWSGLGYHIRKALTDAGATVTAVGELQDRLRPLLRWKERIYRRVFRKRYLRDREPLQLRAWAAQVARKLRDVEYDVVLSPGSLAIAYLRSEKPIVVWTDSTFAGLVDFYPECSNLSAASLRHGHRAERAALSRAALAVYTSEWAARTALEYYEISPAKVAMIPFGANIDTELADSALTELVEARMRDPVIRLLFMGVNWHRKGGDIALAVAAELHRRGLAVELHIVGCAAPEPSPAFVHQHGFVSKRTAEGRRTLDWLFRAARFFILPARSDCVPVVLAEANSYGLPCLTTNVGGIATAVVDGRNGFALPPDTPVGTYCDLIVRHNEAPVYRRLASTSSLEYTRRLNWRTAGDRMMDRLRSVTAAGALVGPPAPARCGV